MATVTKKDIITRMSDTLGVTNAQSAQALDTLIDIISSALSRGDDVALRTFGTFEVRLTKAKLGRNPAQPHVAVPIPPRHVVRFKPGQELKESVAALPMPAQGE